MSSLRSYCIRTLTALCIAGLALAITATPLVAQSKPQRQLLEEQTNTQKPVEKDTYNRVFFLLNAHEFMPTREHYDPIAPAEQIVTVLKHIASDEAMIPSLRMRAIDSLGLYPQSDVRSFLATWLQPSEDAQISLMRHHAMMSLAQIEGEKIVPMMERYITDDDIQLRLTAIVALGVHAGDAGQQRLKKLQVEDTNPHIQDMLQQYIK